MTMTLTADIDAEERDKFCGAKRHKHPGATCRRPAGWGTGHVGYGRCKLHGGSTPTQRTALVAQILDDRARQMFGRDYDAKPVANPLAVFERLSGKVVAWMEVMEVIVAQLKSPSYRSEVGEQIYGEVQLFERAMDRCGSILATHARLNIDERLAAIEAAKAAMFLAALDAGLAAVGISGAKAVEARRAVGAKLRVMEAEAEREAA